MKLLNRYKNGNVNVSIYDDGTRVCENDLDNFDFDFPISFDFKITNYCKRNCKMCHERSSIKGKHGDIMRFKFIDTLRAGTEVACGGGAVTSHPDLIPFLNLLKSKGVIANITVHQEEFNENLELINKLIKEDLVHGIGVSYSSPDEKFWENVLHNENIVVHVIAGLVGKKELDFLSKYNAKVLILGYKDFGRGHDLIQTPFCDITIKNKIQWLKENIKDYYKKFKVTSFDNLGVKQLNIKDTITDYEWDEFYNGEDGTATMYIDAVKEQFAMTSTSIKRYNMLDNIDDMFHIIKEESFDRK